MKRLMPIVIAMTAIVPLWGCGERPQEMSPQKHGEYQGKPDGQPWDGAPWNGNKRQWEDALKARNQNQNEYTRVK